MSHSSFQIQLCIRITWQLYKYRCLGPTLTQHSFSDQNLLGRHLKVVLKAARPYFWESVILGKVLLEWPREYSSPPGFWTPGQFLPLTHSLLYDIIPAGTGWAKEGPLCLLLLSSLHGVTNHPQGNSVSQMPPPLFPPSHLTSLASPGLASFLPSMVCFLQRHQGFFFFPLKDLLPLSSYSKIFNTSLMHRN